MKLPFSLFLALRYLKPKRTFVSVITLISVAGVVLGVAALLVVISVMTGFDQELRRKVLGFDAHLMALSYELVNDWEEVDADLQKSGQILASAPFTHGPVIVEFEGKVLTPKMRGIQLSREQKLVDLQSTIKYGELKLESDQAVIGIELARNLGIGIGDKLIVYAPRNLPQILQLIERIQKDANDGAALDELKEVVLPAELEITGIFESGRYVYDSEFVLVPLHIGQELYGLEDAVHGIAMRLSDPYSVEQAKEALSPLIPPELYLSSWIDQNRQLFDAIRLERNTMFIILLIIIVVAGFGIMNTLITVTVQKTRDIGVLKALGARPGQIVFVFLLQGIVVAAIGTVLGLALGLVTVHFRNEFKEFLARTLGIEIFPPGIYQFSQIPAEIVPQDIAMICVMAFIICSLAALLPAANAARLDPVKALRYE